MSTVADESQELIGKVLKNRYEVLRELGRGGMAIVYLCKDRDLDRNVVVKAPKKALAAESEFRQRFEREIRGQLGMEHPHICKVMDAETKGPFPYVVLQYLSGGDLNDKFKASPHPMPMKEILAWLPQVAKALDFIHSKGWVHRDVKPGNTMFDEHGNAFVGDFGIARAASSTDMELTQTGALIGSPQYMAPDLMLGHELSPAYDQYALGCMVYAALSKRIPHQASTPIAIVHLRAIRPIPPLSDYVKGVPPGIEAAVMKSLERNPKDRFGSCEELYDAIRDGERSAPAAAPAAQAASGEDATMLIGEEERTRIQQAREAEEATRVGTPSGGTQPGQQVSQTVYAPPPKKGGGLKIAAALAVLILGGGGYAGWKWLQGQQPPQLVDLTASPGAPVQDLNGTIEVRLDATSGTLQGELGGKALKSVSAVARADRDPFYSGLPAPKISCTTVSGTQFRCSVEAEPGRYAVDLTLSGGFSEEKRSLDLLVADSGLVPLPPNAAGRPVYLRVSDGARVVDVPAGGGVGEFLIDEHEVSWSQYFLWLQAQGRHEALVPEWAGADTPAVNVDYESASAYCEWAAGRLPTSKEWTRAAAGDQGRSFPWGGDWASGKANTADPDGHQFAAPVREFSAGASPYGVLNLVGNVAEWVGDKPSRGKAKLYGGSFRDRGGRLGSEHSESASPKAISISYGLRCAMNPPAADQS